MQVRAVPGVWRFYYLNSKVFTGGDVLTVAPDAASVKGFDEYIESFKALNSVEKAATEVF